MERENNWSPCLTKRCAKCLFNEALLQFCSLSKSSVLNTTYGYLVKALQCLTGSCASVDHGFANLPDVKHGRGLDIIPIFLSKRVNAVKICRKLEGEN